MSKISNAKLDEELDKNQKEIDTERHRIEVLISALNVKVEAYNRRVILLEQRKKEQKNLFFN